MERTRTDDVTYVYDAAGNLVGRTDGGGSRQYVIDLASPTGYTQVIEERTGGNLVAAYAFGNGPIGQWRDGSPDIESYYLPDGQGSVAVVTDADTTITDRYIYDAFGTLDDAVSTVATDNPYRFTGERFDSALGQYELRARRYAPDTGTFTTADPLRGTDVHTLNLYTFGNGDAVNKIDPSGMLEINAVSVLTATGIMGTAVSILIPVVRGVMAARELLEATDFVIEIRQALDDGWLPYEDFDAMKSSTTQAAFFLIGEVLASGLAVAKEILTSFAFGQVVDWMITIGGGGDGLSTEREIMDEGGQASVQGFIEEGDASHRWPWHHLVFNAALRKNKKSISGNLLHLGRRRHSDLHAILTRTNSGFQDLVPGGKYSMAQIRANYKRWYPTNAGAQYLADLRVAYQSLQSNHGYKNIVAKYDAAVLAIGGTKGLKGF